MRSLNPSNQQRRLALKQLAGIAGASMLAPWATAATGKGKQRIISVGGAITEIIFALNANNDLVAVDTTSNFPESVQKLPNVGYARALSAEGVLALAPTQIIASEDAGPPAVIRQLSSSGIPLAVLPAHHKFEGVLDRIRQIGELTGTQAQAATLMQGLQKEWAKVRTPIEQRKSKVPKAVFILAHAPNQIMVAGRETAAHAVLEYAGASNALTAANGGNGFSGYKPLTPEAMIAAQPDIIVVTDQGLKASGGIDSVLKLPGVEQTPAGRKRRVLSQEAMLMLGFGPRLPIAISQLDSAITRAMQA
ncbi:hemin ABC transporter substrate-binding protein [Undibacterium sp.]|uniref:heme/hemin ABC transporter substrate-binding protein n=1 Tax=Undibacterium sp. TaxID=1914977 RepID=UPI00273033D2|nr:ABC transporter substrate-binding protein [Undibacterium sp.]MDP1977199.1 ABC transporter substrate-binding protein [Undibacterium sp.]